MAGCEGVFSNLGAFGSNRGCLLSSHSSSEQYKKNHHVVVSVFKAFQGHSKNPSTFKALNGGGEIPGLSKI